MGFDPVDYLLAMQQAGKAGGGGDKYLYENCYSLQLSRTENTWTDAPAITIDCAHLNTLYNLCNGGSKNPGYKKVRLINVPNAPIIIGSLFTDHSSASAFEAVELDGNLIATGNSSGIAYNSRTLKSITGGAFDLSGASSISNFAKFAYALETVYFVPSTIKLDINFQGAAGLTDESLVSAANGLDATASGHSITLDSTVKAKLSGIMGTVTGGVFALDAGGGTTLLDFATTTKGWTVA